MAINSSLAGGRRRGEAPRMAPQLEAEHECAGHRSTEGRDQSPSRPSEHEQLQFSAFPEAETLTAAPLIEVSFSDVPENFFSEGDFASEVGNGVNNPTGTTPSSRRTLGEPPARGLAAITPSAAPSLLMRLPHSEGLSAADRLGEVMSHELREMSPAPVLLSASTSKQSECVVPQASKADLLTEKGRISMEICDLMDALEGEAYGRDRESMQRKLEQLKQQRYPN